MMGSSGASNAMGTPHPPTLKWGIIGVVALFIVYHFTCGKGRK
jgi:hypothetical protein